MACYCSALAEDAPEDRFELDIEAENLGSAMAALIRVTGAQAIYPYELAHETGLNPVHGTTTLADALETMFEGTQFSAGLTKKGTIIVSEHRQPKRETAMNSGTIKKGLLAAVAGFLVDHVAYAAEVDANTTEQEKDTVIVTGTRVQRDGFEAPTPTVVLNVDAINRDAPQNLGDFVQKFPAFANSSTTSTSVTSASNGAAGVNNLNLRSIGANRTLILLDGRRMGTSVLSDYYNNTGSVDINPIPDALIKRVDVVTGGASAPYGSDAIAGIVNFVIDHDFTGLKGSAQGGITSHGDAPQYSISLAAGTGFANDRGHVVFSIEHDYNDGIIAGAGSRDWLEQGWERVINPDYTSTNGLPYYLFKDRIGSSRNVLGGLIYTGPLAGTSFGEGGAPRAFNYGTLYGTAMQGGEWQTVEGAAGGSITRNTSLESQISRISAYSRASYQITDNINLFGSYIHSETSTLGYGGRVPSTLTIQDDNPFIPDSVRTAMAANSLTSFSMTWVGRQLGGDMTRKFNHIVGGLEGDSNLFGTDWSWELAYTRSNTRTLAAFRDNLVFGRFFLATDVVTDAGSGLPVCRSTLTDPTNGCVPYNPMGLNVNSQAAENYVYEPLSWRDQNIKQSLFTASATGEPFSLPAGPVSVAVGYEHRKESTTGASSDLDKIGNYFYGGNFLPTIGSYDVDEGFIETVVPVLRDMLDVNGAVRVTDYSTSGTVVTWKAGATFQPVEGLLFRFARSRDIRSPGLSDFFNPGSTATITVNDPFQGGASVLYRAITQGNSSLNPEVAATLSTGLVVKPQFIPGFSASVDYYSIDLRGAIVQTNSATTLQQCYDGNTVFCDNIVRDGDGNLLIVYAQPTNANSLKTKGLEFAASYSKPLSDFVSVWDGTLSLQAYATHVIKLTTINFDGSEREGTGAHDGAMYPISIAPKWRYMATVAYDSDFLSTSVTGRGFGSGVHSNDWVECSSGCPANSGYISSTDNNYMPGAFYMDANITFHLGKDDGFRPDLFFAAENVFDRTPEGFTIYGYAPGNYDRIGRRFRAGIRFDL